MGSEKCEVLLTVLRCYANLLKSTYITTYSNKRRNAYIMVHYVGKGERRYFRRSTFGAVGLHRWVMEAQ
jgi:hypothetical protein